MANIVVIGSGVAGLTAAAYMVQKGHVVRVFEQFPEIGGVTATLHKDGFSWDLGPMLLQGFGPGEPAGIILSELGITNRIKLEREDRGLVFPDFELWKEDEYKGPYWRKDRLKEIFPHESMGLDRYYKYYDKVMDLVALKQRSDNASGISALLLKLRTFLAFTRVRSTMDWSAEKLLNEFFIGPELKGLYNGILADFVVRPSQFPAPGVPMVNVETPFDKRMPLQVSRAGPRPSYHYIIGGCEKLVEALAGAVRSGGGEIFTNSAVRKIVTNDNRVTGIEIDGSTVEADMVIASGGAREMYFDLVGRENLPEEFAASVDDVPLMESVHMVHLGIDFDTLQYQPAALCYYYGTYDVEDAVDRCLRGEYHEGKDGFLIYVPSLHSPEMAPKGHHAVTVYTIAPNNLSQGTWSERKREFTDKLLDEAEKIIPGLKENARVEVIMTPEDFKKRTHLKHHAFGGRAPVMGKKGGPHRAPIKGLWFVGSQSEKLGGGVWGTMDASRKVIKMIQKEGYYGH